MAFFIDHTVNITTMNGSFTWAATGDTLAHIEHICHILSPVSETNGSTALLGQILQRVYHLKCFWNKKSNFS